MRTPPLKMTVLLAALLMLGVTACTRSNSSDASQSDGTQPSASQSSAASPSSMAQSNSAQSNSAQSNSAQSPERAQRREAMRKKIEAVLTPEQVKELDAKTQQGEKMRKAMSEINLTADQKAKIKDIYAAARAERQQASKENSQ